jgi:hypothetical protein
VDPHHPFAGRDGDGAYGALVAITVEINGYVIDHALGEGERLCKLFDQFKIDDAIPAGIFLTMDDAEIIVSRELIETFLVEEIEIYHAPGIINTVEDIGQRTLYTADQKIALKNGDSFQASFILLSLALTRA